MKRVLACGYAIGLLLTCACAVASGEISHSLESSARFRLGYVDPATEPHGRAGSVLLRGQLRSQWHAQWHTEVALDHIAPAWRGYHNTGAKTPERPIIPDAGDTGISRLLLGYRPQGASVPLIHLGRQALTFDNQRLIGSDNFWQNEHTFDALSTQLPLGSSSRADYAYIHRTRGIYARPVEPYYPGGTGVPDYRPSLSSHRHDSHLARIEWNEWDYMQWVGYAYQQDNRDVPQWSNDTLGVRYRFSYRGPRLRYRIELDAARQTRTGLPDRPRPTYRAVDVTLGQGALDISARHEHLGSGSGGGFITPLGSNYRFQGLTGRISPEASTGLRDSSLALSWRRHPWRLDLRQHWFADATDNERLGRELNLEVQFRITRRHQFNIRYGRFSGTEDITGEQRVYMDYSFNR